MPSSRSSRSSQVCVPSAKTGTEMRGPEASCRRSTRISTDEAPASDRKLGLRRFRGEAQEEEHPATNREDVGSNPATPIGVSTPPAATGGGTIKLSDIANMDGPRTGTRCTRAADTFVVARSRSICTPSSSGRARPSEGRGSRFESGGVYSYGLCSNRALRRARGQICHTLWTRLKWSRHQVVILE